MLNKDPRKRPSVKKLLEFEFISTRINEMGPLALTRELGPDPQDAHSTCSAPLFGRVSKQDAETDELMCLHQPKQNNIPIRLSRQPSNKLLPSPSLVKNEPSRLIIDSGNVSTLRNNNCYSVQINENENENEENEDNNGHYNTYERNDGDESKEMRTKQHFLWHNGERVQLQGVEERDSI